MIRMTRPGESVLSAKPAYRRLGSSYSTLGMDVGTSVTKVIWTGRSHFGKQESCVLRLPTRVLRLTEEDRSGEASRTRPVEPAKENSECGRSDWQDLARRLRAAFDTAGIERIDRFHGMLSMDWCDLRTETGSANEIQSVARPGSKSGDIGRSTRRMTTVEVMSSDKQSEGRRMLSLPEDSARALAEALDDRKLELQVLDAMPWCAARAAALFSGSDREGLQVMIDWGYRAVTFTAMTDGNIFYCRKLDRLGLRQVTAALQSEMRISELEAQRLIARRSSAAEDEGPTRRAEDGCHGPLVDHAKQIAAQVSTAVRYLNWRLPKTNLERIVISGGGGFDPILTGVLSRELAIDVVPWSWTPPGRTEALPPDMALAAGLVRWE